MKEVCMVLVFEIALVIILFVCLIYGIKYIMLLSVKHNADKNFEKLCSVLPKLYGDLTKMFSNSGCENSIPFQDTQKLISQALNFSPEKDGNERIIAYANSIMKNALILADMISEKDNKLFADYEKIKNKYNKSAEKLRHYADVFPTSFYARLKKIKTMDYLN